MKKGFIKKALAVACAGSTIFGTITMSGCRSVEVEENNGYLILKEIGNIYSLHKASFYAEGGQGVSIDFESACGYQLQQINSGTKGYIVNEKKGVVFSEREYACYKSMDEINPDLLQHVQYCEECFAE